MVPRLVKPLAPNLLKTVFVKAPFFLIASLIQNSSSFGLCLRLRLRRLVPRLLRAIIHRLRLRLRFRFLRAIISPD